MNKPGYKNYHIEAYYHCKINTCTSGVVYFDKKNCRHPLFAMLVVPSSYTREMQDVLIVTVFGIFLSLLYIT